jgi:parallel beta-helix repeat protein
MEMKMRTRKSLRNSLWFSHAAFLLFILVIVRQVSSWASPTSSDRQPHFWIVNQQHSQASDQGPGTESTPFKTISRAAALAQPGDTVVVHAGIYRERVTPARGGVEGKPITYQAAPGEKVVVKGSELYRGEWRQVAAGKNVYTASLDMALLDKFNPYATRAEGLPGKKTLGQVFVDGELYSEVDNLDQLRRSPGTWMAAESGQAIHLHFQDSTVSPEKKQVEYTVRNRVFAPHQRGLGYITVRGFVFEHCANQGAGGFWETDKQQAGMVSTRSGHHWVIEKNIIRYAKSLGIDIGSEGGLEQKEPKESTQRAGWHLIRNNTISDNGEGGIAGINHQGTRIIGNVFERNNALHWEAIEEAALKTHFNEDGLIEGNLFRNNDCPAIWLDNTYTNVRVTRNLILNNAGSGIFLELGYGPALVDNNVIGYNYQGIYAHDAAGITVTHNFLFCNAQWGIFMRVVTDRTAEKDGKEVIVQTSHERIANNLIIDNGRGAIAFPLPWERAVDNFSDFNLLGAGNQWEWLGINGPVFAIDPCEGRVDKKVIREKIQQGSEGLPPASRPDLNMWEKISLLTLDQWRAISGYEKNSGILRLKQAPSIGIYSLMANLNILNDSLSQIKNYPIGIKIERDYFGNPFPADAPLPGPFQCLKKGENLLLLWPVIE